MALDTTGLFTVIGKHVKSLNTAYGYITALESAKDAIFTVLEAEDLEDYYATLPGQYQSFQSQVTSWVNTILVNIRDILLDRDYVIDELSIYSFSITDVLNGLYDYMEDNSVTIKSSIVTLGGSDTDKAASENVVSDVNLGPVLFVSRTLDGVSDPGNNISSHIRYDGAESQLARSATIYAELINNTTIGAETAQLFSGVAAVEPYQILAENPGNGPTISNPEASNLIPENYNFTNWTGDAPSNWSLSGTITTDYEDASDVGVGPLRIKTEGVTATQQITGLTHNRLHFMAAYVEISSFMGTGANVIGIRLKTLAGSDIVAQVTLSITPNDDELFGVVYTFFRLPDTVDLEDIYFEFEFVTEDTTSEVINLKKVVITPATYYNGLAWVWWPPFHTNSDKSLVPLGDKTSIAVVNGDQGVFQTMFRKGFNIQLPSADSPSIADSLAT